LLSLILDAVYVDMGQGLVLGLKPKPEFLPLFNLGELVTTGDSEFWGYGAGSIAISLINRSSTYISTGPRLNTDLQVTP